MEERKCLPFNQMVAELRAEGQHTIVQGDKVGLFDSAGRPATVNTPKSLVIYTSNGTGSRGYEVGGDRAVAGRMPGQLCVRATLANVQFHNAAERTIPASWRLPNSLTREQVLAEANRRGVTRTADYNGSLDQGASHGAYPAIKASFVINGQVSSGFLDVRMYPATGLGASATVAATGFSWQTDTLVNMGYGQFALDTFRQRAQLAAQTPRK
ncbi:hypothetical protein KRZ98_05275 [Sphingobium sp. AS12]|uniref:hypothetical protein n=1 Tax=Sphingobium sp. AS12 TaxID=2849495 RepID=UPI001C318D05|nr:hypothetical protein [Sphingobium sp. AS12]MBV2147697.1 hypothetical protein [Sphingobium sp. AS12]